QDVAGGEADRLAEAIDGALWCRVVLDVAVAPCPAILGLVDVAVEQRERQREPREVRRVRLLRCRPRCLRVRGMREEGGRRDPAACGRRRLPPVRAVVLREVLLGPRAKRCVAFVRLGSMVLYQHARATRLAHQEGPYDGVAGQLATALAARCHEAAEVPAVV